MQRHCQSHSGAWRYALSDRQTVDSVLAGDTSRDFVTATCDLLTLVSGHTWRVTWSTPTRSLNIPYGYPFLSYEF